MPNLIWEKELKFILHLKSFNNMDEPNLTYIKKLSGGDTVFEDKIISILKEEFPIEKESYDNSINSNNYEAAAEVVHKLKHKISILGLEKSYNVAVEHEKNLNNSSKNLTTEFNNVLKIITTYLKEV